ncbi:DUF72 domain-containing protein [Caenispirillum bisanense]|uniref:Uncharacterized conserved protein YecE, DUF72 family n=1 Tax=Caenispirillum bisanense TaxID=414052 RepID=A0A286GYC8_9PROT|nr:DUF72 domain-containing protein [Caenispirillum bisanense]SOE00492.1 Uncharacterized conserved protein YecE, DUF72 family [Caenispirillum bisanense]
MIHHGDIRIGVSGWRYAGWRGVFYPPKLAQRRELEFASRAFRTLEINGTHYSLQRPDSFAAWADATPDDFVFTVKASRYLTHMLRLKGIEEAAANFWAQGLLRLGPKLGPVLWQFPPSFRYDPARLETFFASLPRDTEAAAALAARHDQRLEGRAWTTTDARRRIRHVMEIRHDSFRTPDFVARLRRHDVGLVVSDSVDWPCLMDVTSDLVYLRLHGSEELYASGYDDAALDRWAARVAAWATGAEPDDAVRLSPDPPPAARSRDVFVFFDNDRKVRAPFDAQALEARLQARFTG